MAKNERARRRRAAKKRERTKRLARARNVRRNEPTFEPYVPGTDSPYAEERFLRRMALELARGDEVSEERVEQLVAANASRPWFEIAVDEFERSPLEQAQELAYCALETPDPDESLDLAEEALELDQNNCDALYVLACALREEMGDEAWLRCLYDAVEAGVEALGGAQELDKLGCDLGSVVFARPYLRSRARLALALRDLGQLDAAVVELEELLRVDVTDTLGVRDVLVGLELARGELERARQLIAFEPGPDQRALPELLVSWARVIERWLSDDEPGAQAALAAAREQCPELVPQLVAMSATELGAQLGAQPGDQIAPDPNAESSQLIRILLLDRDEHSRLRTWLVQASRAS